MSSQTIALVLAIAAAVTSLVLAGLGGYLALQRQRLAQVPAPEPLVAERVMVQLLDGSAIAGVLTRRVGGFYVVEGATLHESGGSAPIDGAAWIDRARVNWIQVEGGKA